jgi:hypothetical protein
MRQAVPDFFVVGAFKCGTTALHSYLRAHPQVFMPFHKEPLFFGDDLTRRYGRLTQEQYLRLFRGAAPGQRVGEASSWYLYSQSAPHEIAAFSPEAQIVVMLRNPVDVMYAQHSQLLYNVEENLADFAAALDAEPERRRGERLPPGPLRVETLYYRQSVRFAEQLERYLDVFGRGRVHITLYDDFRADTARAFRAVLEFLKVDPSFIPDLAARNSNKRARVGAIQRLIYQPPGPLIRLAPLLRRSNAIRRLRDGVLRANSASEARPPMDLELRMSLLEEQAPEIERLGRLIGRDLSSWIGSDVRPATSPTAV